MDKQPLLKHLLWLLIAAWVYTLTFVFNNYWSKYASYSSVTNSFQDAVTKKEQAFADWATDSSQLQMLMAGRAKPSTLEEVKAKPFAVFIYKSGEVAKGPVFWSTNEVLPDAYHVSFYRSGSFVKYGSGQYELLKRTMSTANGPVIVVGLVLLHTEFFIENGSLQKEYPGFGGLDGKMLITTNPTPYDIVGERGRPLFYFSPQVPEPIYVFNRASFIVECVASLFLCLFVSKFSSTLIRQKKVMAGLLFFSMCFLLLRIAVLRYSFPIDLEQLSLFGTNKKPAGPHSDDLGHLMLNAVLAFWVSVFITRHTVYILQYLTDFSRNIRWFMTIILAISVAMGHFVLVFVVRNLYLNSSISFDLTNFLSFDYTTTLSLCILFLLCVAHYLLVRFAVQALMRLSGGKMWPVLTVVIGAGLVALTFFLKHPYTVALLFSLLWLLVFFITVAGHKLKPAPAASGATIIWLFVYAVSISLLLGMLGDAKLKTRTYSLGKSLLMQKDSTSEYLVKYAAGSLKRMDWFELLERCANEKSCDSLKKSIKTTYFGDYLKHYTTGIYLFNKNDSGIYNEGSANYESLNTLTSSQGVPIGSPGLFYFSESFDRFGYIIKHSIRGGPANSFQGTLFVVVRSLSSNNEAVSPELFRQLQDFAVDLPPGFSYGWYKNGILIEQYRNYSFPAALPPGISRNQSIWENETKDAYEIWMNAGSNMVITLAAERKMPVGFISMMAYLFGAFLLFYLLLAGAGFLLRGSLFSVHAFQHFTLTLQSKIRITVIAILMVAFVIVAVVTISFFINQFKTANENKLSKTVQDISTELAKQLGDGNDSLSEKALQAKLQGVLQKMAVTQNVDANCFDSTGKMIATTLDIVYERGVISPMADPLAWWYLKHGQLHRYISNERIGRLSYSSIYQVLRNKNNKVYAYLQVPYFSSQNELKQEISNFLVILINIIAFVFLLSGSLAFWISGSITRSFNIIAEKMDRIRLSERNERIEWTRNDEIGHLVSQYNKMVDQLEESARMMARSERETAWREMARQVAHEIKNPLTPMKLSLQFLQKAIKENRADVAQVTERVAGNLVGQIDHLSNIATEFSQFANLGNVRPEHFDLQQAIREVIQLYGHQDNLTVNWEALNSPQPIFADRTQINRLFTNLFQNAVEAVQDHQQIRISIGERLENGNIIVSFKDNGKGIPESVQPNIFIPNFTTKSSGTGLGLAICKAIVENAGGDIWFETEGGVGTTFYVKLPLAET